MFSSTSTESSSSSCDRGTQLWQGEISWHKAGGIHTRINTYDLFADNRSHHHTRICGVCVAWHPHVISRSRTGKSREVGTCGGVSVHVREWACTWVTQRACQWVGGWACTCVSQCARWWVVICLNECALCVLVHLHFVYVCVCVVFVTGRQRD